MDTSRVCTFESLVRSFGIVLIRMEFMEELRFVLLRSVFEFLFKAIDFIPDLENF